MNLHLINFKTFIFHLAISTCLKKALFLLLLNYLLYLFPPITILHSNCSFQKQHLQFYNSFFLEKFIRKIPLLKIFYVGLTWALINSWLILPEFNWPIFLISWLFISALVLPFDIRDMKSDTVVTFPRLIGIQKTKYLAYALVFISLMISIFYLEIKYSLAFFLTSIFTFILIFFSENTNKDSYFSFWVETCSGLPLLFLALNWLIN